MAGFARECFISRSLNHSQDTLTLYFADADSGRARPVLTEKSPDSWVNTNYDLLFAGPGKFLLSSWRDGNDHIYLYSFDPENPFSRDVKMERQLYVRELSGAGINAFEPASQSVFFTANADDPRETQIYSVKLDGSGFHRVFTRTGHPFGDVLSEC